MLGEAQNLISWVPGDEVWDQVGDLYLHHILIFCSVRNPKWQNGNSACHVRNSEVPGMNQLVKDHKETLKTRPVCRAKVNQIPNGPLADLVCEIVNPFVEEADRERRTEVGSTEELCAEIKAANDRIEKEGVQRGRFQRDGSLIVGSKDVEAHYPNIDVEVAA